MRAAAANHAPLRRPTKFPARPAKLIESLRVGYLANDTSMEIIAKHHGVTLNELMSIRAQRGWPMRGQSSKPKGFRSKPNKPRTSRQILLDARADAEKRTAELYGTDVDDVRYLQWRGFIIFREGPGYRVGNQHCTAAELREKAARERRLEVAARPQEAPKVGRPKGHAKSPTERAKLSKAAKARWRAARTTNPEARP